MDRRQSRDAARRLAVSALLLSLMLILGYVESLIPLGASIPGVKLGLSNGVLIFALVMLDTPTAFALMAMKVVLSGMLFSGVSAMLYGLAGGLLSLTAMALLTRARLDLVLVSLIGGVLHNAGQLLLSMLILRLPARSLLVYMLVLAAVGALCGVLTGVCARGVLSHLRSAGWKAMPARKGRASGRLWIPALALVALAIAAAVLMLPRTTAVDASVRTTWDDGGASIPGMEDLPRP